jgi:patatin-like phospholipase/acyl hydrolase
VTRERGARILSLSGGAYLGLYTACVLERLEARLGGPLARHFDLVAGCSVGGILALGLAAGVPAAELRMAFERRGTAIFSSRPPPRGKLNALVDLFRQLNRPKFSGIALRGSIAAMLGADTTLADLPHAALIPTFCVSDGTPRLFAAGPWAGAEERELLAVDVAMATSAAPVYFPLVELAGGLHTDGGLYATAPDLLALHEMERRGGWTDGEVAMLSIGTATAGFRLERSLGRQFGLAQWADKHRLVRALMAAQERITERMLGERLGERYLRLDAEPTPRQARAISLETATPEAQQTLHAMAEATARQLAHEARIDRLFADERRSGR